MNRRKAKERALTRQAGHPHGASQGAPAGVQWPPVGRSDLISQGEGGYQLPGLTTDPGCDHPLHRAEVYGAMEAMSMGHRWNGKTQMDCGCQLWITGRA